jgi:hypothetical protein
MKKANPPGLSRMTLVATPDLLAAIDEARARLRREGRPVPSASGLIEVAVRELLARKDLAAVLDRHGARARRTL